MTRTGTLSYGLLAAACLLTLCGAGIPGSAAKAAEVCEEEILPPEPVFTPQPTPTPTPTPATGCPPAPDPVNYAPPNNMCLGSCSKWQPGWAGGATYLTPTTGPASCFGRPMVIVNSIFSSPSTGSVQTTLDPLTSDFDYRFYQAPNTAQTIRFRTPSVEGTTIKISSQGGGGSFNCCTGIYLSRSPCGTSGPIPAVDPLSGPPWGQNAFNTTYIVKKNVPSDGAMSGKCGGTSLWNNYSLPQLEADTYYYLTVDWATSDPALINSSTPLTPNFVNVQVSQPNPQTCGNAPANPVPTTCP